jgi:hypothetical protein
MHACNHKGGYQNREFKYAFDYRNGKRVPEKRKGKPTGNHHIHHPWKEQVAFFTQVIQEKSENEQNEPCAQDSEIYHEGKKRAERSSRGKNDMAIGFRIQQGFRFSRKNKRRDEIDEIRNQKNRNVQQFQGFVAEKMDQGKTGK